MPRTLAEPLDDQTCLQCGKGGMRRASLLETYLAVSTRDSDCGIAGLTAALRQRGFRPEIIERNTSRKAVGGERAVGSTPAWRSAGFRSARSKVKRRAQSISKNSGARSVPLPILNAHGCSSNSSAPPRACLPARHGSRRGGFRLDTPSQKLRKSGGEYNGSNKILRGRIWATTINVRTRSHPNCRAISD